MFDPRKWRPQTPTAAYMELRDDDAFWAARRVAAFTDEMIRAAVHTGQFSDPAAEKYLADVLIQRREKIKSIYLTQVNPIVNPALDAQGPDVRERRRRRRRRARHGRVPRVVDGLRQRHRRDQADRRRPRARRRPSPAPSGLPSSGFVAVDIAADSDTYPTWKQPVRAFFRQEGGSWKLVGFERLPEQLPTGAQQKAEK